MTFSTSTKLKVSSIGPAPGMERFYFSGFFEWAPSKLPVLLGGGSISQWIAHLLLDQRFRRSQDFSEKKNSPFLMLPG